MSCGGEPAASIPPPGQAGAAPRSRHARSTYAGHRSWHFRAAFNSSAQSSSRRQSEVPPRFQHKKWVEMHQLAGRVAPLLSVTAPQQSSSAESLWPALQMLVPHPGLQKTARASPTAWREQRIAHSLWLVAQHSTHTTRAPSAAMHCLLACTWATPGHAAVTALAQFFPHSRQAGRQHGSLSVRTLPSEDPAFGSCAATQPGQLMLE